MRRVVVAGGETSGAVVGALGVESVVVRGEEDTGVPWCVTTDAPSIALPQVRQLRLAGPPGPGRGRSDGVSDARQQIVDLGASLFARRLTFGRTDRQHQRPRRSDILVTPTGASLGALDALSVIDADGRHVDGPKPSKEAFLHAAVYRARPAEGAVIHLHSTYSVAVSCLDGLPEDDVLPPLTAYYVMRVGALPLLPYHAPGDPSLEPLAEQVASRHHAFLLANHGPVVAGADWPRRRTRSRSWRRPRLFLLLQGHATRPLTAAQATALRAWT